MLDQGVFQVGFGILVLEVEELQHEGVFDGLLGRDGVARLGHFALFQHRRLVVRQGGALVKLAVDLAVELAHRPAATQRLGFIKGAGLWVLDREQAHVGRPRQRKGLRQCREFDGLPRVSGSGLEVNSPDSVCECWDGQFRRRCLRICSGGQAR
jgi:hypothetical protein